MSDAALVAAIILNWNGMPLLLSCLGRILASDYPNLVVFLVDNGSTDGSVEEVRACFPKVGLLETGGNLGYSAGNNLGLRKALDIGARYILLLNNDTEIAQDMISSLVKEMELEQEVGVASPKIYLLGAPERLWAVGGVLQSRRVVTWGINEVDSGQFNDRELDFVFGCGMMIRREVLERAGVFDIAFRFYYEDIDLCLRAKQAGYKVIWVPSAIMWHVNPAGTLNASEYKLHNYERSRMLFFWKHLHGRDKGLFALAQPLHLMRVIVQHISRGQPRAAYWRLAGALVGALDAGRRRN
jgi:GT2 family glycosyltransferase